MGKNKTTTTPAKRGDDTVASKIKERTRKILDDTKSKFGSGAVMCMGFEDAGLDESIHPISTGSINVDEIVGNGGLPRGRIVEIYGPESSGKTTLTLHLIAQAQRQGLVCAFIDAEHALDTRYARALGVKLEELLISQPDYGEQALEIVDALVNSAAVGLVVVDSVAALVPKAELEGEMGDHHVGLQARMMSQAMRKLNGTVKKTEAMVVFINQLRQKIGVTFGSPETTTGGNALKFYSSVRLDIRRIGTIKDGDRAVGARTRVKVAKNKCATPFRTAEIQIDFGTGISREGEILDRAIDAGLVQKAGSWFSMGDERMGQGRTAALTWLRDHPERAEQLLAVIRGDVLKSAA